MKVVPLSFKTKSAKVATLFARKSDSFPELNESSKQFSSTTSPPGLSGQLGSHHYLLPGAAAGCRPG